MQRLVPLSPTVGPLLGRWTELRGDSAGPLFCPIDRRGNLRVGHTLSGEAIRQILSRRTLATGVAAISPHDLRRTYRALSRGSRLHGSDQEPASTRTAATYGAVPLSREVFENPRVAIRWLTAFGVAVVVLMVATVVRGDKAPIPQIWGVLIIGAMLSSAVTKFRSGTPSPRGWYDRMRMIVPSAFLILIGAGVAVTRAGGARVVGVMIGLVSLVLLVAELRDLRLWRAQIRRIR